jgi:hypothetical protein
VTRSDYEAMAYATWKSRPGAAAVEIEKARAQSGAVPYAELEGLKALYPKAVSEYIGLNIYSPGVRAKMRKQSPDWEPPPLYPQGR